MTEIILGLSIIGGIIMGAYYNKWIKLNKCRDIVEFKKLYKDFNLIMAKYDKYNEDLYNKNALIREKAILTNIITIENIEEKWSSAAIAQNHDKCNILYKKLEMLHIKLEENQNTIKLLKVNPQIQEYEDEFKIIFKKIIINKNLENLFDLSLASKFKINQLKQNIKDELNDYFRHDLDNLVKFSDESNDKYLLKFKLKEYFQKKDRLYLFAERRIDLDYKVKHLKDLEVNYDHFLKEYSNISKNFIADINELLKNKINFIDLLIEDYENKEKAFLDLYKDYLPYFKLYKTPEYLMLHNKLDEERQLNFLKDLILKDNSNHNTYFWLCYDEFWTSLKYKTATCFPKNLKFIDIDSQNVSSEPAFYVDNFLFNDFYLKLQVFALQIFLVQHIDYLKFLIPIGYFGVILIISYFLYKKIKFWYNCYKTKTVKTTFLNWLFDPEILFTTSKLGLFYSVAIIVLLGGLYYFSGFGYWFTFIFCGRVFLWNWTKYFINKLNKKYIFYICK